jgi:HPt (histidine-containing phosphotransfer) domain-containing protein
MQNNLSTAIDFFIADTESYIASIDKGINSKNFEQIRLAAHTIKSSSMQIGAEKLSCSALTIEMLAVQLINNNTNDISDLSKELNKLKSLYISSKNELQKLNDNNCS